MAGGRKRINLSRNPGLARAANFLSNYLQLNPHFGLIPHHLIQVIEPSAFDKSRDVMKPSSSRFR
jgi:hypothetical protein